MRSVQATASSRGALVVRAATQRKPAGSAKKSAAPKTANPGRTLWLPNTVRGDGAVPLQAAVHEQGAGGGAGAEAP